MPRQEIREHTAKVAEYEGWMQVFASCRLEDQFELNADDYLFFFSK